MTEKMEVLIAYDSSECADVALHDLRRVGLPHQVDVVVIAVAAVLLPPPRPLISGTMQVGCPADISTVPRGTREHALEKLQAAGLAVWSVVKEGDPKWLLPDEADHWQADCIFVGARGLRRIERLWLGSVSAVMAARAHCSVEVIRTRQKP
jgi:nucleotide-binding universal stress UspA family protein